MEPRLNFLAIDPFRPTKEVEDLDAGLGMEVAILQTFP